VTVPEIINGILDREGWNGPDFRDKDDRGGRTAWGISERAHPEAWKNGPPSRERATGIYLREYVAPWDWLHYEPLRVQLIDCTVHHGYRRAVKLFQRALGVDDDGVLGRRTIAAYELYRFPVVLRYLNNGLVAYRLQFIDKLTDAERSQKRFEEGWENRALLFIA
jgi:lysozyme family protein